MPKPFVPFWNLTKDKKDPKKLTMQVYGKIYSNPQGFFGSSKDDVVASTFVSDLAKYPEAEQIHVYINSPGGEVFAANSIRQQLVNHQAKVFVHVDGIAASAATVIAAAGDVVSMARSGLLMIHNPLTTVTGNAKDMEKTIGVLNKVRSTIVSVYKAKTKLPEDKIVEIMDAETWLDADEALKLGFIDEIIEDTKPVKASMTDESCIINDIPFEFCAFTDPDLFKAKLKTLHLEGTTSKGENTMDFQAIVASLEAANQVIILNHLQTQITAAVEAQKTADAAAITAAENATKAVQAKLDAIPTATAEAPEAAILAGLTPEAQAYFNQLADQNKANAAAVARLQMEANKTAFYAKMQAYDKVPLDAKTMDTLFAISNAVSAEEFANVEAMLKVANTALSAGFTATGVDGDAGAPTGETAHDKLNAAIKVKMTADAALTYTDAMTAVIADQPELYEAYRDEIN